MRPASAFALALLVVACKPGKGSKKPGEQQVDVKVQPASYDPDVKVDPALAKRCKFDQNVAKVVVDETPGATFTPEGGSGKVLNMKIVSMRGMDPAWQGERSVIIEGELVQGTELPGNNGIETSPDGREIYVVSSGFQTVVAFSHTNPARQLRTTRPLPITPDNVHLGPDGQLLTAGMKNDEPACGGAPGPQHDLAKLSTCPRGFVAIAIDSGGVATGPLANTFLLALGFGVAAVAGRDPLVHGLGLAALIALAPIVSVMLLCFVVRLKSAAEEVDS